MFRPSSALAAACLCWISGCGAQDSPTRTSAEPASLPHAPVPAPAANAAVVADALPTDDLVALDARMKARPLIIPRPHAPDEPARFTVDEGRRGGFAMRLSTQALLTPAFSDGRIYLGAGFSSRQLHAFDAKTGTRLWTADAPDGGPSAAIIEDGVVLYNTESCTLFAVDARSGRELWKRWLGDPLMSQPAARNGRVFSGHIRDRGRTGYGFTALDLRSGNVLWSRDISADVMNAAVLDSESVFFTTMDGVLWKLDQRSGRVRFRRDIHASSAPWLDGDRLHLALREERGTGAVEIPVVLAKASGEELARREAVAAPTVPARPDAAGIPSGWAHEGSRATVVDDRLYQTIGNEVLCRDAETGRVLWRRRYTDEAQTRAASPPAIAGAQMVIGTERGELMGLDIDTGLTLWSYALGEPIRAQPTIAEGWVYAATTNGTLFGIEVADSALDGWHMWGGNAAHSGASPSRALPREEPRPTRGTLVLGDDRERGEPARFGLTDTTVTADVQGFAARVRVEQTYRNPYARAVEAVYVFPLPDDAAVDAMELRAGSRVVRGQIRPKEQAQREYDDARNRGVLASILEQQKPNLFRQRVANIRPGDEIRVVIEYVQALPYEDGSYRLVFPTAAAPTGPERERTGEGRIVLQQGDERADRVHFSARIESAATLRGITSPSHSISRRDESGRAVVSLPAEGVAPDRDIELRLQVGSDEPGVQVVSTPPHAENAGFVSLLVHPRISIPDDEVAPREVVFVVDTSSSMLGAPLAQAQAVVRTAIDGLRAGDAFNVIAFDDRARRLFDRSEASNDLSRGRARTFVDGLRALGTTDMELAVRAALEAPSDPARMRIVVLVTDGYIGDERPIFRAVNDGLGDSRVFTIGVGSAVNRYLLTRVAELGRGAMQVAGLSERPEEAARVFASRIAKPYLTDVELDWGRLAVHDVYPRRLPDLFADQPLVVHARYDAAATGRLRIRGRIAGRPFEESVQIALRGPDTNASARPRRDLPSLWARTRIRDLMTAMALQPNADYEREVTDLGLRYGLLTDWTAFIAIDEGYDAAAATTTTLAAPGQVPLPPAVLPSAADPTPSSGTTYDFESELVTGDLVQPEGELMQVHRRAIRRPLVRPTEPATLQEDAWADEEAPRPDMRQGPMCRPRACTCPDGRQSTTSCRPDGTVEPCRCG